MDKGCIVPLSHALPVPRQQTERERERERESVCVCVNVRRTELLLYQRKLGQHLLLSASQLPRETLLDGQEKCLQRAVACHALQLLQPLCLGYSGSPKRARDLGHCVLLQFVRLGREEVANDTSRRRRRRARGSRACSRRAFSSA